MIIKKFQTLVDFTAQYGGTVDELFNVALGNGIGITDDVAPGVEMKVEAADLAVSKYYAGSSLDITSNAFAIPIPGGIGYMQIGTNFIVS